jgi:photosystem II stability/assembly factor-like uncharacterized protein
MPISWRILAFARVATLATLGLITIPSAARAQDQDQDRDDATRRQRAWAEWYNDDYRQTADLKGHKKGGPWSPQYRRFMMQAAAEERAKWGALIGTTAVEAPAAGTAWVNLGPTKADVLKNGGFQLNVTDSGRVRNIVVNPANPSQIYVAMAGGGVWKTNDSGTNWTPITESLGSLSTGWLEMDPATPSTLYLGLGDPFDGTGVGLVKSTDGGATWSAPKFLGDSTVTTQIMVAPTNPNIVLATTNKGLFRSTDAGATWGTVAIGTSVPYGWSIAWTGEHRFVLTLEANPTATSGTTDGQIWYSTDDGATWARASGATASTGVGRMTVAASPSNRDILYALAAVPNATTTDDLANIFKSTNGGVSWTGMIGKSTRYSNGNREARTPKSLLGGQGWYNQLVSVHPFNPQIVYFGGALHMAKTTDGGATFSQVTNWLAQFGLPYVHADYHAGTFDPTGNTFYVGTDGGIFRSSDNGATWSDAMNVGIVSHLLYNLGSAAANPDAVIGGMQDNGTRVRVGASSTFNQTIGGDGFGCDINPVNPAQMLGSIYYTQIRRSTDGGQNFTSACSGIRECGNGSTAPFFTKIVRWAGDANGNTLFTFSNTKVYKTTNYAGTWTAMTSTGLPADIFIRNIGVATSNGGVVGIVTSGGRAFLSTNGGAWTQIADTTKLPGNELSLSSIWFDSTNPSIIYISSVAPSATASHLWKSTDSGATWTAIESGLPSHVPVNTVLNDPNAPNVLYAGTHLGVYRSTDGGASWVRFGSGLPLVNVTDLFLSADSTLVRLASYGRGFWQLQ